VEYGRKALRIRLVPAVAIGLTWPAAAPVIKRPDYRDTGVSQLLSVSLPSFQIYSAKTVCLAVPVPSIIFIYSIKTNFSNSGLIGNSN
jgi:hypothetical protein